MEPGHTTPTDVKSLTLISSGGELNIQRELQRGNSTLTRVWKRIERDILDIDDEDTIVRTLSDFLDEDVVMRPHVLALVGCDFARYLARLFSSRAAATPLPYVAFQEGEPAIDYPVRLQSFVDAHETPVAVEAAQAFLYSEYHLSVDGPVAALDSTAQLLADGLSSEAEDGGLRSEMAMALKSRIQDSLLSFQAASASAVAVVDRHADTLRTRAESRYAAAKSEAAAAEVVSADAVTPGGSENRSSQVSAEERRELAALKEQMFPELSVQRDAIERMVSENRELHEHMLNRLDMCAEAAEEAKSSAARSAAAVD